VSGTSAAGPAELPARRLAAAGWRVALVHDWLTGMRGGEKVLDALCVLCPDAHIFTLLHVPGSVSGRIAARPLHASFVQHLPRAPRWYRNYLPLFPAAVESFDLDGFDLVISSSHCAVKSVVVPGRARHLCYCHSPMRYAWDQFDAYFGPARLGRASRLARAALRPLARWDAATSGRPDRYVANSQYVARRIRRYYNRSAAVVAPPVDTVFYTPAAGAPGPYLLVVSALVPYKRLDIAIHAARAAGMPLKIAGEGGDRARLEALAGPDVEFLGRATDETVRELYRGATAVLLPGEEDFGIVPVEAQACGRPVIALARGGALETVVDGETGLLVDSTEPGAWAAAMQRVRDAVSAGTAFLPGRIRAHAEQFSRERFLTAMAAEIDALVDAPVAEAARW
jgi:glycosyltransferase involved in cell wall biosynthesis